MALPVDLPICALEDPFADALQRGPVVVTSPTGSGKSTWIPCWAAGLTRDVADPPPRVLVVEPRRVACRSLARFVARSLQFELGQQVGYAVRHDDRLGRRTRLAYVTPGVALRLLDGARLTRDQVVILDEFHQRGLETDLLLAVLLAQGHRRLCVLSATMDAGRVAAHVKGTVLEARGRVYPVQIRYLDPDPVPHGRHLAERVAAALLQLRCAHGDVLVFLPGKAEIAACQSRLAGHPDFDPLPLHAELSSASQDQAFAPADRRRVILATNVAETSITLPYVRSVIDSGLVRRTVYREGRGALTLAAIAMDAADQRAGRAGRLGPGVCLRLWSESGKLEPHTPPEILREDLSQLVLQAARLGHTAAQLPWLDAPRDYALEDAQLLLLGLKIVDAGGQLTQVGRQVGRLPVDPVLGRLLEAGREFEVLEEMVLLVAALAARRSIFLPGHPCPPQGDEPDPLTETRCDVTALILALRDPRLARGRLHPAALAEAQRVSLQLARLLGFEAYARPGKRIPRRSLERAILAALPDAAFARRVRRDAWGNGRVELVLGRESLVEERVKTMLVVDQHLMAERGRRLRRIATCCMPVAPARLRELGAGQQRAVSARVGKSGELLARIQWSIGTTVLQTVEDLPRGQAAREALRRLLSEGRYLAPALAAARDEIEAFNLQASLAGKPGQDFARWLEQRIQELGFDSGEDLPLITAGDFAPGLLSDEQRSAIDDDFPRSLRVGELQLRVTYEIPRRRVTLHATRAKGRPAPRADFLPRWPGWSVAYHDGKHTVMVKG